MEIIKKIFSGNNSHKVKRTILVIEEKIKNQGSLQKVLSKKYHILMTADKEVAYKFAIQEKLHLIIISRNGKKTIDLCTKLKNEERTKNIPILVIAEDGSNIVEYYFQKIEGYLIKPFNGRKLLSHAEELIKNDKIFGEELEKTHNSKKCMEKLVSIIIPVYNDQKNLGSCLQSIYSCDERNFEVIVVDDYSNQNIKTITEYFPCKYLRLASNRGQSYARNVGVKNCLGEIILFTDSDCLVMPNWVEKFSDTLFRLHQKDDSIVAVCGQLKSDKGFIEMSHAYSGYAYVQGGKCRFTDYLNTSCVAIYKEDFLSSGGFSEDMRNGEDPDLALRLSDSYKKVLFEPSIWVIHNHGVHTCKDMLSKHRKWGYTLGLSLIEKHPRRFKLLRSLLSQPVIHFLTIAPLAIATTIKIIIFNFKSDKKVFMYFPGILINKIFFRWGIFIKSIQSSNNDNSWEKKK
jgi:glycosyltransferase involved in cell wall biosynthesis